MSDFHGESLPSLEGARRSLVDGLDQEMLDLEIEVLEERFEEVKGKPGQGQETFIRGVEIIRAMCRRDGWDVPIGAEDLRSEIEENPSRYRLWP